MKSIKKYMRLPYTIETKKEHNGTFFLSVKELPGCVAFGSTLDEAKEVLYFSMLNWLESCIENAIAIPLPFSMRIN